MFTIDEILKASGGKLIGKAPAGPITGVSTDTRTLGAGALFVALRGERFDGHQFLKEAFHRGASAAMIDEAAYRTGHDLYLRSQGPRCFVIVRNTYEAFAGLAHFHRMRFQIPVVGITGSAGKTTTKECVAALLRRQQNVLANSGNFNNEVGLPLTLLQLGSEHQAAVFEMGARSKISDIEDLCRVAEPTLGVITNIQPVHLERLGSLDAIYQTKLALGRFLAKRDGILVINGDDERLVREAKKTKARLVTFGFSPACHVVISEGRQEGDAIRFTLNRQFHFTLKGYGTFNIRNAAAALAVARELGLDLRELSEHWHDFVEVPNRFHLEQWENPRIQLIKDCYNANPISFSLALKAFEEIPVTGKRIIVAGDMRELGSEAEQYHRALGREIAATSADLVVAVGEFAPVVAAAIHDNNYRITCETFTETQSTVDFLVPLLSDGDSVFLKASRAMKFEEIADGLRKKLTAEPVHSR